MQRRQFSVMIKPVGSLCNLNCSYCYYHDKNQLLHIQEHILSDTLLEKFIRDYFAAHSGKVVTFVWHGGEPSLAGIPFYEKVIRLQKRYCPQNVEVWNNLQTNGTLLDDRWCEFLAENHFDVGLSIDGTEEIHNRFRGENTYQKVRETCFRLQRAGIQPDLLCTVTAETAKDPLLVYNQLKSFQTGWIQFIPIVIFDKDGNLTEDSVTAEAYGRFLCAIFDEWFEKDRDRLWVQIFAETFMKLRNQAPSLCTLAETCGQAVVLEHDGNVYACDHFVFPEHCLGNIRDQSLLQIVSSEKLMEFAQAKRDLSEKCLHCSWLKYCRGGCQKNRKHTAEGWITVLCEGYRMLFAHIVPRMEELIRAKRK